MSLCLPPPCSSALGVSPKTSCRRSEWGCYVCNGPHMPLDRTDKPQLLLQWDVCHKSFPKGSQPSVTIGNCPRKPTHSKSWWAHMVLELQVHNQLESLLWGLFLGEEWQGQGAKERARVWGVPEPPKRGMPSNSLRTSHQLPLPNTTSQETRTSSYGLLGTFNIQILAAFPTALAGSGAPLFKALNMHKRLSMWYMPSSSYLTTVTLFFYLYLVRKI